MILPVGQADGFKTPRNVFQWPDGEAAEVGSADLREHALHEESHGVVVGDDNQRAWGSMRLLQLHDRKPEKPVPQWLEAFELISNLQGRVHLAGALEEADQLSN